MSVYAEVVFILVWIGWIFLILVCIGWIVLILVCIIIASHKNLSILLILMEQYLFMNTVNVMGRQVVHSPIIQKCIYSTTFCVFSNLSNILDSSDTNSRNVCLSLLACLPLNSLQRKLYLWSPARNWDDNQTSFSCLACITYIFFSSEKYLVPFGCFGTNAFRIHAWTDPTWSRKIRHILLGLKMLK